MLILYDYNGIKNFLLYSVILFVVLEVRYFIYMFLVIINLFIINYKSIWKYCIMIYKRYLLGRRGILFIYCLWFF